MSAFQTFLKSVLAICAAVSENTLLLDRWIITAPGGPIIERQSLSPSELRRDRYLSALKTSLIYAVSEPLWCWIILAIPMHSPHNIIFCFLFGGFFHIVAVNGAERVKIESLKTVKKEHEEHCGGAVADQDTDEARRSADLIPNDEGEKEDEKLLESGIESPALSASVDSTAQNAPKPAAPCRSHKLNRAYHIATYPPVVTAALTNAGLILYCRYLPTADSQVWLDNFAFGWTVIALLAIFILAVAKWSNQTMHHSCLRPFLPARTAWDSMQMLSSLAIILGVRAILRLALSQSPFTPIVWSEAESAFVVQGFPVPEPGMTNEDGTPWQPDPVWKWLGLASSTANIVGWSGYWVYRIYNRSRERRQARMNS